VNTENELVNLAELQQTVQRLASQVMYIISWIISAFVRSAIVLFLYLDGVFVLHYKVVLLTYSAWFTIR
jgi:hypothetical protein